MRDFRNFVENELLGKNIDECGTKRVFDKVLDVLNLKKEFSSFVKKSGTSKEEPYAPFIKKHVSELWLNANKWAKIFEIEEEDRTNKKHRTHIARMLPYLKEIGKISFFFLTNNKTPLMVKNSTLSKAFNGNFKREYPGLRKVFY